MLKNYKPISTKKFYLLLIGLYLVALAWLVQSIIFEGHFLFSVCPSKLLWHIPCPGCGVTRALLLILKGDILSGISLNPNVILAVFYFLTIPILGIGELITHQPLLYQGYLRVQGWLVVNRNLLLILIFELLVWGHNILIGN